MQKKEFYEIPSSIVKLLVDRSIEKKNVGYRELENFMRQVVDFTDEEQISSFIKIYKTQLFDNNTQSINILLKKASIGGFYSIAYLLKSYENINHNIIYLLIQPLISTFKDSDTKITLESSITLIKILKIHPKVVIKYFNDILEGLLTLYVNLDQEVRNAGNSLDVLLKDLMDNSLQLIDIQNDFNVDDLFQKLYEKIRANHPSIRILIVSWITFLDSIPEVKIINNFHEFMPGLFNMLSDKSKEVNQSADKCLKHFLKEIDSQYENISPDFMNKILEIAIEQTKSSQDQVRINSFEWIYMFLQKYFYTLSLVYNKNCMTYNHKKTIDKQSYDLSNEIQFKSKSNEIDNIVLLKKIPFNLFHKILDVILLNVNNQNEYIMSLALKCNTVLTSMVDYFSESENFNIKNFEEVIKNYFYSKKESTLNIIINWIVKLFSKFHEEMFLKVEVFIENFTNILYESNDNIFNSILDILCEVSKYKGEYIEFTLSKILEKLSQNKNLLNLRGLIILKKFCSVLSVQRVYLQISDVLYKMKDIEFISSMINILDIFLLTYNETQDLRTSLKNIKKSNNPEMKAFFEKIFTTWSFNPVSTLILCLISEFFELSYYLILKFSEIKIEQEYFIQLSQLVQLIESSLFNNIRALLLEPLKNIYLVKTLYGILMLLPQGKAYQALARRLKSVEMLFQVDLEMQDVVKLEVNFEEIEYFMKIFNETQKLLKQIKLS